MGNDIAEDVEASSSHDIKVHNLMCSELNKLVNKVSKVLPEIEAVRPGSSSGIKALCSLTSAIDKAKLMLQHCRESSKLYLALTGDAILLRCNKSRFLLEQSLSQIQNMVPVVLAAKISSVIGDVRQSRFSLDPSEVVAGKILRDLLHQYTSESELVEETTFGAIQVAALRLDITSQKALVIEKRSIRKLLNKLGECEPVKRKIFSFFLNLLNMYGERIVEEHKEYSSIHPEAGSCVKCVPQEARIHSKSQSAPPNNFICPLYSKVMYDPVVITSGQTFERMFIQKWFGEGHDTCPKTRVKMADLTVIPNAALKDFISQWCLSHGITIPDPSIQATIHPFEKSSTSIASLSSSLSDLSLPIDFSNLSLGSSDKGNISESTATNMIFGSKGMSAKAYDDFPRYHFGESAYETDIESLSRLDSLPWESQLNVFEKMERLFKYKDQEWEYIPCPDLIQPLIRFLKHAHEYHDVKARTTGCLLLLAFIKECRNCISYISNDAYGLLASLIDTEVVKEALSVLEALSHDEHSRYRITASGALVCILRIFGNQNIEFHGLVLNILCNLSEDLEVCSLLVSNDVIPKLVPFIEDSSLGIYCITILKNMSYKEDARVSIAETDGCIASLAKLLESSSHEVQEHVVAILLSVCSQRIQYRQLVKDEDVILGLVTISINGNSKAKSMAMKLLWLLER